jgi:hypothetical protein
LSRSPYEEMDEQPLDVEVSDDSPNELQLEEEEGQNVGNARV